MKPESGVRTEDSGKKTSLDVNEKQQIVIGLCNRLAWGVGVFSDIH